MLGLAIAKGQVRKGRYSFPTKPTLEDRVWLVQRYAP